MSEEAYETRENSSREEGKHKAGAKSRPAAGPHARPDLIDEARTPGAGTLSESSEDAVGDGVSS